LVSKDRDWWRPTTILVLAKTVGELLPQFPVIQHRDLRRQARGHPPGQPEGSHAYRQPKSHPASDSHVVSFVPEFPTRSLMVHRPQETAQFLGQAGLKKTLVLTGAMVPYQIAQSDALFNLGFACAAAGLADAGVYIAMNGQLFPWNDVIKNRVKGIFEPLR
jgi:hypothetical protein